MKSTYKSCRLSLTVLVVAVGLAACSNSEAKKPASQVAAKVNSQEISVHQINFALARANAAGIPPEQAAKVRQEVLNKLIDQELVVEQAMEKKLDRSPNVMMALEAARQEVLTRAYFEQLGSSIEKPTPEETKRYYSEHPQLFSDRRVFNIQELTIQSGDQTIASQLKDMVVAGKPLEEVANWLKEKDIKFNAGVAARAAEQIPLELLPRVHALKEGQGMVIQGPNNIVVMRVAETRSAPVSEAQATPTIELYLRNQRLKEMMLAETKQLREKAKITYQGEFADAGKALSEATESKPAPATATEMPPAETTQSTIESTIEKGVAGLK